MLSAHDIVAPDGRPFIHDRQARTLAVLYSSENPSAKGDRSMKVALIGAELEENLGLRYMHAALESQGHTVAIIAFNSSRDLEQSIAALLDFDPDIAGLSMVFTSRAKEFCHLAQALRDNGFEGRIVAGGHFACLNAEQLLKDFAAFDLIALGEGEEIICRLAEHLEQPEQVAGICYRTPNGQIVRNPSRGNPEDLDALPFPKRTSFSDYFGKPIASILSSRGCWRNCAFCSINAWYKQGGGKKFRIRSVENIIAEMKALYFDYGVRIFNMQDDNFFLPHKKKALLRFEELRSGLRREGVTDIAIAVKARPDSITESAVAVLDDLGLFRVFLGVENASQIALHKLNRKCRVQDILNALRILNDFDVHIAYNLLMFELDTTMDDILTNLRFIERHIDNPFNFCRAEAYAGTGLEAKLRRQNRLLGDYFGIDYRLKDPRAEAFHHVANFVFFDRNFSESGLHYFNMQVDFYFQILRRFYPELLTETLRSRVRNFIKHTNLDTFACLSQIFDFITGCDPTDQRSLHAYARFMRERVDAQSQALRVQGEHLLDGMHAIYEQQSPHASDTWQRPIDPTRPLSGNRPEPYQGLHAVGGVETVDQMDELSLFGLATAPVPYDTFKRQLTPH
jgi:radical SAM superfamily enzyme YgiQ (UPF0313 family)